MEIFWSFLLSSIAGFSTVLGCFGILVPVHKKDEFISFALGLSLSVMIMVSLFDLIPSSLPNISDGSILKSILIFTLFFGLGVFLVSLIHSKRAGE